jgi:hydrogenase maturation protease
MSSAGLETGSEMQIVANPPSGIEALAGKVKHPAEASIPGDKNVALHTLILGLGNPILGDDGVGWRVAEEVANCLEPSRLEVEVDTLAAGGLSLMERLVGYERAILIDAITTGDRPPGMIVCMELADLPDQALGHMNSAHDASLVKAMQVGRLLQADLPARVNIIGIEIDPVYEFGDEISSSVLKSIPQAVEQIMELIK